MPYTGELMTRGMSFGDNVDPTDRDYLHRRRRWLDWAQQGWDEVWNAADWGWKLVRPTAANLILPANSYEAPLPDDFGNLPAGGGIFDGPRRLAATDPQQTSNLVQGVVNIGGEAINYTVHGWSRTLRKRVVQFGVQGPLSLWMYYNRKPPQLSDKPEIPTPAVGAAGLPNGAYNYLVTHHTFDLEESEESLIAPITLASQKGSVTIQSPGPAGEHKILFYNLYRTIAGPGGSFYRVTQQTFQAGALVFLDNVTDAALILLTPFVQGTSSILQIPEDYHHTVLLPSMMKRAKRSKGDTRDWFVDYEKGLKQMIINERPRRETAQRLPMVAPRGMW